MHQRACDLDNPSFPTLKKKTPRIESVETLLFDDLFTADSIDGENVILMNNEVSLCEKASQLCCHSKTTLPPTTTTTTTVAPSDDTVITATDNEIYTCNFIIDSNTKKVLSVEITNVCLQSKSKDSHWLFLHVSVCD